MTAEFNFKSTEEIKVSDKIVEQVIGQDKAIEIAKKAAKQRRHVFLIGQPGTGKSMIGLALAELLPKSELEDILVFPNPKDENNPVVKTVPAGHGNTLTVRLIRGHFSPAMSQVNSNREISEEVGAARRPYN